MLGIVCSCCLCDILLVLKIEFDAYSMYYMCTRYEEPRSEDYFALRLGSVPIPPQSEICAITIACPNSIMGYRRFYRSVACRLHRFRALAIARAYLLTAAVRERAAGGPPGIVIRANNGTRGCVPKM